MERALGSSPIPHPDIALENVSEEDMVEFYNLKDSLYESNLDLGELVDSNFWSEINLRFRMIGRVSGGRIHV